MAKTVMLTDDAAFMRRMLKDILTKNGFEVISEAENGIKAVEMYKRLKEAGTPPDLVTLDITMPELSGIETLKQIMAYDSSAVCIMCSAMGQQGMVVESIKAGAKDFIVKPFQTERVLEAVGKALG